MQNKFYNIRVYKLTDLLTIPWDTFTKGVLHAEALAANKTMSVLVQEWIDEQLGLAT
jgi:hypothetical protein